MQLIQDFWKYLENQQTTKIRWVHLVILLLVITQITISNFMHVPTSADTSMHGTNKFFSWLHFGFGFSLLLLSLTMVAICFRTNGVKYYYAYLWGDLTQIKNDINDLRHIQLPNASFGGLAASVQGLGLGAMLLVVLSGVSWFGLWSYGQFLAPEAKSLHKALTGLVEFYICGHGLMGITHFWLQRLKTTGRSQLK